MKTTYTAIVTVPGYVSVTPIVDSEYPTETLGAARAYIKRVLPNRRVAGSEARIVRADGRVFDRQILDRGQWINVG